MNLKSLIRYVNTVKFLKPSQLFYQIRYRIFRKSCKNIIHEFQLNGNTDIRPVSLFIGTLDLSENFINRFDADGLLNNNFKLLNQSAHVDLNKWYNHEMSHLWNFNLHYFEYAVPLADKFIKTGDFRYLDKFRELINTWISMPKTGDGWHPYTSSLRIINWLICMDILGDSLDKDFRKLMYKSIYEQYIFITKNFELHILGNHYFDNLKTAVICAVLFNDSKNLNKYLKLLKKEIKEEILPDGMHFELSFMYHKIIMESLIRTLNVLRQLGESENKAVKDFIRFSEKILAKMADALYYAENGIDRTPLFNDSGDNVAKTKDSLFIVCRDMFRIIPQKVDCLNYSGYYRLEDGSKTLLIDCGQAGSSYIPGHSQCDALSFELFCGGMPVFVNSGTGLYQGVERQYFRSTKAHNPVVINGREQSDCWG